MYRYMHTQIHAIKYNMCIPPPRSAPPGGRVTEMQHRAEAEALIHTHTHAHAHTHTHTQTHTQTHTCICAHTHRHTHTHTHTHTARHTTLRGQTIGSAHVSTTH